MLVLAEAVANDAYGHHRRGTKPETEQSGADDRDEQHQRGMRRQRRLAETKHAGAPGRGDSHRTRDGGVRVAEFGGSLFLHSALSLSDTYPSPSRVASFASSSLDVAK